MTKPVIVINHFYQRGADNTADVSFTGIGGRIVSSAGVNVDGWVKGAHGAGTFENVAPGVYQIVAREAGGATVKTYIAVGDLAVVGGQSNASHWFSKAGEVAAAPDTYMLSTSGAWETVSGAGARDFCNTLSENLGVPVAIEDAARGHTALLEQDSDTGRPWWLDGQMFTDMLAIVKLGGTDPAYFIWDGGEDDAMKHVDPTTYETSQSQFFQNVESGLGAPQIFIQEVDTTSGYKSDQSYYAALGQAEVDATHQFDYVHIGADGTGLPLDDRGEHYAADVYPELAITTANSIWNYDVTGLT